MSLSRCSETEVKILHSNDWVNKNVTTRHSNIENKQHFLHTFYRWSARHAEPNLVCSPSLLDGIWGFHSEKVRKIRQPCNRKTCKKSSENNLKSSSFSSQNSAGLGSSEGLNWLSEFEFEVWECMNAIRKSPRHFAELLEIKRKHSCGRTFWDKVNGNLHCSKEGSNALEDAIEFLNAQDSLDSFCDAKRGMNLACIDHYLDCGQKGIASDSGSDDSKIDQRLEKYGTWESICAQLVVYGCTNAIDIVLAAVVDDGVSSRCHRKCIFHPKFSCVGIGYGFHLSLGSMCVIAFAEKYSDFPMVQQRICHLQSKSFFKLETHDCRKCSLPTAKPNSSVFAMGSIWHSACFVCFHCKMAIEEYVKHENVFTMSPQHPICCPACFVKLLNISCEGCGKKIVNNVCASIDGTSSCCTVCFQNKKFSL